MYIEQCEWFDKSAFKLGLLDPYYRKLNKYIMLKFRNSDGIIAISSLLEKHYKKQGVRVCRIPTILNTDQIGYSLIGSAEGVLKLVFAGSIDGGKELLYPIFKAIDLLGDLSLKIEFNILGPEEEKILKNIENDKELLLRIKSSINIHGRVQQQKVDQYLLQADFMIFIRPDRRSSNAGFPTKLAESMAVGTPVITNLTSDIGMYLCDGENGYKLNDTSTDEVINVIKKIILLDKAERMKMRENARKTAEKYFDYHRYKDIMKEFLQ